MKSTDEIKMFDIGSSQCEEKNLKKRLWSQSIETNQILDGDNKVTDDKTSQNFNVQPQSNENVILNPFFQVEYSFKKRFNFGVSLFFTQLQINFTDWHSWDQIAPLLFLGKIPSVNEAKKIKENIPNLKLVVSVVEPFELKGKAWPIDLDIQSPQHWKDMGIEHHLLPIEDFTTTVAEENLYEAVKKIHEYIVEEKGVYVHCKAGRSRSALVCACYLAVYGSGDSILQPEATPDEIYSYLQSKRKQVSLNERGLNKIQNIKTHHQCKGVQNYPVIKDDLKKSSSLIEKLNSYFASLEGKKEIAQLTAFKELSQYAADKNTSLRAQHIQNFLNSVRDATSARWYFDFCNGEGPLKALLDARPFNGFMGTGQPKNRQILIDRLKKELEKHVLSYLKCKKSELNKLFNYQEIKNFNAKKSLVW